ncbi:SDR family oxidoreductase [Candidatus Peregrinibacteria bacterium]|nr:SDR family oxidoreductase [Candidatus Peregrinibacteria bacterium]
MRSQTLRGEVAIVTGGNTNIGLATAQQLADDGADVAIGYLDPVGSRNAVNRVRQTGRRAIAIQTDIRESDQAEKLIQQTVRRLGDVTILVCNAAAQVFCESLIETTDQEIDEVIDTNLKGTLFCIRAFLATCRGGPVRSRSIIVISSINAVLTQPGLGVYGMTKAGSVRTLVEKTV